MKISTDLDITHIMFVDDMLLFGIGTAKEWLTFKESPKLFSMTTGMIFDMEKSMFYHVGMEEPILNQIQ